MISGQESNYSLEEVSSFARSINKELAEIEELKEVLPIDPDTPADLFKKMYDGLVGLHLLNVIDKDRIDMRTINRGDNMNVFKVRQNLNQFFAGCSGLIKIIDIDAQSFLNKNPS